MKHTNNKLVVICLICCLLAAVMAVGSNLLKNQHVEALDLKTVTSSNGETVSGQGVTIDTISAAQMPATDPDVAGLFVNREDNRVFVGTGMMSGVRTADGQWKTRHDGPVMEVIVTRDTKIYRDGTLVALNGEAPAGQVTQILEAISLDEVGGVNTSIAAWGERRGDRLLATVLIFTPFS